MEILLAEDPIVISNGVAQLFIDDLLIESQKDLKRTLHQPNKDNGGNFPVIGLEDEFGDYKATLEAGVTIVFDPKLNKYVMFAGGYAPTLKRWDKVRCMRFTSTDGIHWIKGDNGEPETVFPKSRDFFLDEESGAYATNNDLFSCYYDTTDEIYPYKGWLWFANWGYEREGSYYMQSRDGKIWERGQKIIPYLKREIVQNGKPLVGAGDATIFYYDSMADRFLASIRFYRDFYRGDYTGEGYPVEGNLLRSRAFLFVENLNQPVNLDNIKHIDLVPPAEAVNGDLPYDEYYISTAWRYESLWLGGLKIWHDRDNYPYSAAGCAFLKLVVSRDGLHWKKVQFKNDDGVPEVFIPNGPEGGNGGRNDGGYISLFSQGPLRIGDELIYYYGCSSYGKNQPREIRVTGGGIFRARLRIDGFVSVDGGILTTKPLKFEGNDLYINSSGPIKVTVLNGSGKRLGVETVNNNSISNLIRFKEKTLKQVIGKNFRASPDFVIRLQFKINKGGNLYSFKIL